MKSNPLLDEFQKRCQAVCDLMKHCLLNDDVTGFYLWGPKGTGKTTGITTALKLLNLEPLKFSGSTSGEGLFDVIKENADSILWFNDDPTLMKDRAAQGYLLHMLEGVADPKTGKVRRIVSKARHKKKEQFEFTGKIIFDSNLRIGNQPVLRAVGDRMVTHPFGPPDKELAAVILYLANMTKQDPKDKFTMIRINDSDFRYYKKTTKKERVEIGEAVIYKFTDHKQSLSLRVFRDMLRYYADEKKHGFDTSWQDVLSKKVAEYDVPYTHSAQPARKDRHDQERKELITILEDAEDLGSELEKKIAQEMWRDATGQSERQFFRRLNDLDENIRYIYENLPDGRNK